MPFLRRIKIIITSKHADDVTKHRTAHSARTALHCE